MASWCCHLPRHIHLGVVWVDREPCCAAISEPCQEVWTMRYYTGYNSDNNMVEQKLQTCFLTSKVSIIPLHWCPGRVTAVLLVEVRPPATSLWVFGVLPADEGVLHTCRELPWLRQSLRDPKWGEGGEKSRVSGLPWITLTYLFTIVGDRCSGEEESHHVEAINEVTSHTA